MMTIHTLSNLTAGVLEVTIQNVGQIAIDNGVMPKTACFLAKSLSLVDNVIGWPCSYGGSATVVRAIGQRGPMVKCVVFYLPVRNLGQPDQGSRSFEDMKDDVGRGKTACMRAANQRRPIFDRKVDTTTLAKCIYDSFPHRQRMAYARKLRGVAIFPGNAAAENQQGSEAYGQAAVPGQLFEDTIDFSSRDLNAYPIYLHLVVAFPR